MGRDSDLDTLIMSGIYPKLLRRVRALLPDNGYVFNRPLLLLQSDDWGRVGLRDRATLDQLRSSGLTLGERPYDVYSLECVEDVSGLTRLLKEHRDCTGRLACITMNFVMANLDFAKVAADGYRRVHLRPLSEGFPEGWLRLGLFDAYREGMKAGIFSPALHGETHFCRPAIERELGRESERSELIRVLWRAGIPYIHWRMPWVGYEYWDPEQASRLRFLSATEQKRTIGAAVGHFAKLFSAMPQSACAPGYRANEDTHAAWAQFGIRVAQNGPGSGRAPHLDSFGVLHLYRTLDFEPALQDDLSIEEKVQAVSACFAKRIPAIVSIHSINFHSAIRDFRSRTLELLDQFLSTVEARHPDLLYVHDRDVWDLVQSGCYKHEAVTVNVEVAKRPFCG